MEIPHRKQHPEYHRWLTTTAMELADDWLEQRPLAFARPGVYGLRNWRWHDTANPDFDPTNIALAGPPLADLPGGCRPNLPLHPRLLTKILKDFQDEHFRAALRAIESAKAQPLAPEFTRNLPWAEKEAMLAAARQNLKDRHPHPTPRELTDRFRAVLPPALLAQGDALLGEGLTLYRLRLLAENQAPLTDLYAESPYAALYWLHRQPGNPPPESRPYEYARSGCYYDTARLNPQPEAGSGPKPALPEPQYLSREEIADWCREELRKQSYRQVGPWNWYAALDPALLQGLNLPEGSRLRRLQGLFPEGPPDSRLMQLLLRPEADKLPASYRPQPAAAWLRWLNQQLADPSQADSESLLPTLRLYLAAQRRRDPLAEELEELLAASADYADLEALHYALTRRLRRTAAAPPASSSPGNPQPTASALLRGQQQEKQELKQSVIDLIEQPDARQALLAKLTDVPTAIVDHLGVLNPPHGQTEADLKQSAPLLMLTRQEKTGQILSWPLPYTQFLHPESCCLAWALPAKTWRRQVRPSGLDRGLPAELTRGALQAVIQSLSSQASAQAARSPKAVTSLINQTVEQWHADPKNQRQRQKMADTAAQALGRALRRLAYPQLLQALLQLHPDPDRPQGNPLRLQHYNNALPVQIELQAALAAGQPALALWWLHRSSPPDRFYKKARPTPTLNQQVKQEFRALGGRDYTALAKLPLDLIFVADFSRFDRDTIQSFRRRLTALANLASANGGRLPRTQNNILRQLAGDLASGATLKSGLPAYGRHSNLERIGGLYCQQLLQAEAKTTDPELVAELNRQLKDLTRWERETRPDFLPRTWPEMLQAAVEYQRRKREDRLRRSWYLLLESQQNCLLQWETPISHWISEDQEWQAQALTDQAELIGQELWFPAANLLEAAAVLAEKETALPHWFHLSHQHGLERALVRLDPDPEGGRTAALVARQRPILGPLPALEQAMAALARDCAAAEAEKAAPPPQEWQPTPEQLEARCAELTAQAPPLEPG